MVAGPDFVAGRINCIGSKPGWMPVRETCRKGKSALSTLPNQPNIPPSWKQEVNRRIAEHRNRQANAATEETSETHHSASARAAEAAARVAARYANAPSYSEMLAGEARAAVRAAEAASRAALEAQAAAEQVLAGLEAAHAAKPAVWELHSSPATVEERQSNEAWQEDQVEEPSLQEPIQVDRVPEGEAFGRQAFEIRWEPDLPMRRAELEGARALHGADFSEVGMENQAMPAWPAQDELDGEPIVAVEPAQPIHANLIEFPREIVATRKVRPRRAEAGYAASSMQLSIFEVDPDAISIEPAATVAVEVSSSPAWTGQEWPDINLDAQPRRELLEESVRESRNHSPKEPPRSAHYAQAEAPALTIAPLNLRLMAAMVNGSLIAGAFLAAAMVAVANSKDLPSLREIEVSSAVALLVVGSLYQLLFYALTKATPGMMYAGLSMSTLDGQTPTRAQRCRRLAAFLLSLLPVGLGVVWALFDEDHLSWHDRLSGTYLKKY